MELEKFIFDLQLFNDDEPGNNEPGNDEPGNNEPGNNEPGNNEPGNNEPGNNEPGNDVTTINPLELRYQFRWNGTTPREEGNTYAPAIIPISVTTKKAGETLIITSVSGTIADQPAALTMTAPSKNGAYNFYLGAATTLSEDDKTSTLTLGPVYKVWKENDEVGVYTVNGESGVTYADALAGTIKVNAPAGTAVNYEKTVPFNFAFDKVAAGSQFTGLGAGDTVKTATLEIGEKVTFTYGENSTVFTAAAKGALEFVGETTTVTETSDNPEVAPVTTITNSMTLKAGTVVLAAKGEDDEAGNSIKLTGSKADVGTDDLIVTNNTADELTVKVVNGQVSSITGLKTKANAEAEAPTTVVIANTSVKVGSKSYTGATITYTCLNNEGTMFQRVVTKGNTTLATQYAGIAKTGGEIYTATWQNAAYTNFSDTLLEEPEKGTANKVMYYALKATPGEDQDDPEVPALKANVTKDDLITNSNLDGNNAMPSPDGSQFMAAPGASFLKVLASTTAAGVTTIKGVEVWTAAANGALKKATGAAGVFAGKLNLGNVAGAVVNYTLPKNGTFDVIATNVSYKSKFVNIGEGDKITTKPITAEKVASGTYAIYHANDEHNDTDVRQVVVTDKDGIYLTTDVDGKVTAITGLDKKGEKVTITETAGAGLVTTVYEVKKDYEVVRTMTDANGKKTVETLKNVVAGEDGTDMLDDEHNVWETSGKTTVASDFNFTVDKSMKGYFKVKDHAATITTGKTTVEVNKPYIAVTINANGVIDSVAQKILVKDTTDETGNTYVLEDYTVDANGNDKTFTGTLTIDAPAGRKLTFNRTVLANTNTIDDGLTAIVVKNAADGSKLTLTEGDKLTTAKDAVVTLNADTYTAANKTSLSFTVNADGNVLTAGTVMLDTDGTTDEIGDKVIVGANTITAGDGSTIWVTASGTSFTIGDLDEGESFDVDNVTYTKTAAGLLTGEDENAKVYTFTGKTVTKANLEKTSNWKEVVATFVDENALTSKYGVTTVNLADADTSIAKNLKAVDAGEDTLDTNYNYVLDKYISKRAESKTAALKANVQNAAAGDAQVAVGTVTYAAATATTDESKAYTASKAQTITVTDGWTVTGSEGNDTINGAAKGKDTINGSAGNDTINLKGAADTVVYAAGLGEIGQDTITGYASGKDKLSITGDFEVALDTAGANVFLETDEDNYVKLTNVAGKAVTINDTNYYFGNGKKAANAVKTTTGATFNFEVGAVYYGNDSGKNTVKIGTLKDYEGKTTRGELLQVDTDKFKGISTIDASTSANELTLTTTGDITTLKGGTYKTTLISAVESADTDTLIGGSGADTFNVSAHAGKDVIKNYTAGKDTIKIAADLGLDKFTVVKSDVVIGEGNNTVTVAGASGKALTIVKGDADAAIYNVGKSGEKTNNTFTYVKGGHYVGNKDTHDAAGKYLDTLKVSATVDGKDENAITIDLTDGNSYYSIEAVDASGVKAASSLNSEQAKVKAGVTIKSAEAGSRITGTKYNDTIVLADGEGADYLIYNKNAGTDNITGFGVNDVIQFNGLTAADYASVKSQVDAHNTTITVGSTTLKFAEGTNLTYDVTSKTIKGAQAD